MINSTLYNLQDEPYYLNIKKEESSDGCFKNIPAEIITQIFSFTFLSIEDPIPLMNKRLNQIELERRNFQFNKLLKDHEEAMRAVDFRPKVEDGTSPSFTMIKNAIQLKKLFLEYFTKNSSLNHGEISTFSLEKLIDLFQTSREGNNINLLNIDLNNVITQNDAVEVISKNTAHYYWKDVVIRPIHPIDFLPSRVMERFGNLTKLRVEDQHLTSFPTHLPPTLESLNLSNNRITHLPSNLDEKCSRLRYLYLDSNEIQKLPTDLPKSLYSIVLDNNKLHSLPSCFPKNLAILSATNNPIEERTLRLETPSTSLNHLDIDHTQIQAVDFSSFPALSILSLKENDIEQLDSVIIGEAPAIPAANFSAS